MWRSATLPLLLLLPILLPGDAAPKKGGAGGSKACSHTGFYTKKVVPLCERHFPEVSSKHAWVVQFYHPYVKKVHDAREAYEQLAAAGDKKLGGAKIGAVDCAQNQEFCAKQGVRDAPTTRMMSGGRARDFEGEHTLDALVSFISDTTKRFKDMEEALKCDIKGLFVDGMKDAAVPLCAKSFPPSLEPVPWIISFYESGDINKDKTMRKTLNKVAEKYGNVPPKKVEAKSKKPLKLRVGAVECSKQGSDCENLGVTKLPTIRFYSQYANVDDARANEFESFVDADEIKQWADVQLKGMPKGPAAAPVLEADMPEEPGSAPQKEEL